MGLKAIGRWVVLTLLLASTACVPTLVTSTPPTGQGEAFTPPGTATIPAMADPTAAPAVSASPTPEAPLAALVNGQPVYMADYERQLGRYEASLLSRGIDPNSPELDVIKKQKKGESLLSAWMGNGGN